jgi:tetratricopeptide (TPR) repeat protein
MPENPNPTPDKSREPLGWLRRLLRAGGPGDRIGANIGEGAQGNVVGKNIIQIGTLVIPTIPLIVLGLIAAGGITLLGLRLGALAAPLGPVQMQGAFNVAVAEFGQTDAAGRLQPSEDGQRLSQWVYDTLKAQRDAFPDPDVRTDVQLWHDSLPPTEKGTTLGRVADEQAASKLAQRIGAHMLIWGNLDAQKRFVPHFYISPQLQGDSDAVVGHYQLGSQPIVVNMAAPEFVKRALTARTDALFWFTIGLRQENYGFADKALAVFQQAEKSATALNGAQEGQEILYFLMGQAALFAGDDNTAETALLRALAINPTFVRGQVVLGSVYLLRAQRLQGADRLETTDWQQAVTAYQRAITLAANSDDRLWGQGAAPLALGMAYKIYGDAYKNIGNFDEAVRYYDMALAKVNDSLGPLQAANDHRLLGQAYRTLGSTYWLKAQSVSPRSSKLDPTLLQNAQKAYEQCIAQGEGGQFDTILTDRVIAQGCQPGRDAVAQLLAAR